MSASATFIRSGPASTSALVSSRRRSVTGVGRPRTRTRAPGTRSLCATGFAACAAAIPKSACESARCATVAASASSRASPRAFTSLRCVCFSSCARSSRSFTASIGARDFLFVFFNCLGELLLEFFQAGSLPIGPLGLQAPFFFGEFLRGARGLALQRFEFVAAAMQVGDQRGGFVRFGRKLRARPVDHLGGQAEAPRDVNAARSAGDANHQAIRWAADSLRRIRPRR